MTVRCPKCETLAETADCPSCGTDIDSYWTSRVLAALAIACGLDLLGTLGGWMQFGSMQGSRVLTREAVGGAQTGLVVSTVAVMVVGVMCVVARKQPAVGAFASAGAIVLGAIVAVVSVSLWVWTSFLSLAVVGWTLGGVAACVSCGWALKVARRTVAPL